MQTLMATARNLRVIFDGPEMEAEIEAVLGVYCKHFEFAGAGLVQNERLETLRFRMNPEGARLFAQKLNEWADEAEEKLEKLYPGRLSEDAD